MKAILCKAHGLPDTLVLDDIAPPQAGAGEIVIDVYAASVNYPDFLIIQNLYQIKPELPFSPGSEVAGIVTACGAGVSQFRVGDRVAGLCGYNGFREQAVLPAQNCVGLDDDMELTIAASMMVTYATSYHALKQKADIKKGESILILGAGGGIGLAAIDIAKAMGARIIAAASSEEKLALCRTYGADETLLYPSDFTPEQGKAFAMQIKEAAKNMNADGAAGADDISEGIGEGVDIVLDPVGGAYSEPALRVMAWNGRYLIIGFAAGDIPAIPLNLPLLKGCSLMGVFLGRFTRTEPDVAADNMKHLMALYRAGKIKPHIDKIYSLADTPQAIAYVGARQAKGKVVIEVKKPA